MTQTKAAPKTVALLARAFSTELRAILSKTSMQRINRRNNGPNYQKEGLCATHEFCDANQVMLDAFEKAFHREPDIRIMLNERTEDMLLMDEAWTIAKINKFYGR